MTTEGPLKCCQPEEEKVSQCSRVREGPFKDDTQVGRTGILRNQLKDKEGKATQADGKAQKKGTKDLTWRFQQSARNQLLLVMKDALGLDDKEPLYHFSWHLNRKTSPLGTT